MGEMLRIAANLPDAMVRLTPTLFQVMQNRLLKRPARFGWSQGALPRLMQGIEQFTVDIDLNLPMRVVADPHRGRVLISRQPRNLEFGETALSGESIHDLHLAGTAGDGAKEPVPPIARLVEIAGVHESEQRPGRVPQPAITIVPVALAAHFFG